MCVYECIRASAPACVRVCIPTSLPVCACSYRSASSSSTHSRVFEVLHDSFVLLQINTILPQLWVHPAPTMLFAIGRLFHMKRFPSPLQPHEVLSLVLSNVPVATSSETLRTVSQMLIGNTEIFSIEALRTAFEVLLRLQLPSSRTLCCCMGLSQRRLSIAKRVVCRRVSQFWTLWKFVFYDLSVHEKDWRGTPGL